MSPIHWAADNGQLKTVKFLVEKGANLHSKAGYGVSETALLTVVITLYEDSYNARL